MSSNGEHSPSFHAQPPHPAPATSVFETKCKSTEKSYDRLADTLRLLKQASEFREHFAKSRDIGAGSEATCSLWESKGSRFIGLVVVKAVETPIEPEAPREVMILERIKRYRHNNIVEYLGWYDDAGPHQDWILLGYCNMKDAYWFKHRYMLQEKKFPEIHIWNIVTQLNSALAFLHEGYGTIRYRNGWKAIIHGDVKDSNILLCDVPGAQLPRVRLSDFGFARVLLKDDPEFHVPTHGGNPWYYCPEYPKMSRAADMWASGSTIHTLCLHEAPVDARCEDTADQEMDTIWVASLDRSVIPINILPERRRKQQVLGWAQKPWAGVYSSVLNYWMHRLLDFDPKTRITAVEAVQSMGKDFQVYISQTEVTEFSALVQNIVAPFRK